MFLVKENTHIDAPLERIFLLSTSLALVERELGMHPVASHGATRTEGLAALGDIICWQGWHLGMPQYHVSRITSFDPCRFFQDTMIAGRFKYFQHDHEFTVIGGQVLLKDTVRFSMRWGSFGRIIGRRIMVRHIHRLMQRRFELLKHICETNEWRRYLPADYAEPCPSPEPPPAGRFSASAA